MKKKMKKNVFSVLAGFFAAALSAATLSAAVLLVALFLSVSASAAELPDLDGNGELTSADAVYLLRHTFFPEGYPLTGAYASGDIDRDGDCDSADAVYLLRYIFYPEGYPVTPDEPEEPDVPDEPEADPDGYGLVTRTLPDGKANEIDAACFQTNEGWNTTVLMPADMVMVYYTYRDIAAGNTKGQSWKDNPGYHVAMMSPLNRGASDFFGLDPSNLDDAQMDKDGNFIDHEVDGHIALPTRRWNEYFWSVVEQAMDSFAPDIIVFEEPDVWERAGYSPAFKREWQEYYGEEWQDPQTSPELALRSSKLKVYLCGREIEYLCGKIKEKSPDTKVYLADHSTFNCSQWSDVGGLSYYVSLGCLDGVIGQTWSDTVNVYGAYDGDQYYSDKFVNAYIEYSSYPATVGDLPFYALSDPFADNAAYTEKECVGFYRNTLAASLLVPEISRFEICPWPERCFRNKASDSYKRIQNSTFASLKVIDEQSCVFSAGTRGISFGISDSLSWFGTNPKWNRKQTDSITGIQQALIKQGIPVGTVDLDRLSSVSDLDGTDILILCHDCQSVQNRRVNEIIADWVSAGGTLLSLSGKNQFAGADPLWADAGSPLRDLFDQLGLSEITFRGTNSDTDFVWLGEGEMPNVESNYYSLNGTFNLCFDGAENPLIITDEDEEVVAFEQMIGKGRVIACGFPSACYGLNECGAGMAVELVSYACGKAGIGFVTSDMMISRRGALTAAHAFENGGRLTGKYLDLFSDRLSVLTDPEVTPDASVVYYDLAEYSASPIPRLAFCGGTVSCVSESAEQTVFTLACASGSTAAARITVPDGFAPADVRGGCEISWEYDPASGTVLIIAAADPSGSTVTVVW